YGASHVTFTRHLARQGNVGDIVAKDDSQMTVAHLLGTASGVALLAASHATPFLFADYTVLVPIHFAATIALVRSARFEVLHQANLALICHDFVVSASKTAAASTEKIPADGSSALDPVAAIAAAAAAAAPTAVDSIPTMDDLEPRLTWFGEWLPAGSRVADVRLGGRFEPGSLTSAEIADVLDAMQYESYLITWTGARIHIALRVGAGPRDIIKAYLHATRLHHDALANAPPATTPTAPPAAIANATADTSATTADSAAASAATTPRLTTTLLRASKTWADAAWPSFLAGLTKKGWRTDAVFFGDSDGSRVDWTPVDDGGGSDDPATGRKGG
ncbi:hypothetical protein HK405_012093, partial [Cladochytrium tenue]